MKSATDTTTGIYSVPPGYEEIATAGEWLQDKAEELARAIPEAGAFAEALVAYVNVMLRAELSGYEFEVVS